MTTELMNKVKQYLDHKDIPIFGAASAESLNRTAPEGFRPKDVLPEAKSVLIFAKPASLASYQTPKNNGLPSFYISNYHTYYRMANEVANSISFILEEGGFPSLPIPSYSPMRLEKGRYNGLISFKHAAVEAGLGKMGKNTLLIHPERGNILRFGGLLTTMEWPTEGPGEYPELCPEDCTLCIDACPVGALKDGSIDHLKCMGHCIKHTLLPPYWLIKILGSLSQRSNRVKRFLEVYASGFFENYGVGCFECLKKCPHFPGHKKDVNLP